MIHPTRTNLLILREKARSVANSVAILKARKQALIREFLATTKPFLKSRAEIKQTYGRAIEELALSRGHEGTGGIASAAAATARDFPVTIAERSIWGLRYKDVVADDLPVRSPDGRGYDSLHATPHLDEASHHFEKTFEAVLAVAQYESKLKRLSDEIVRTTRRGRVLEEMVLPLLRSRIRSIAQYIAERERESYYRLKMFKELRAAPQGREEDRMPPARLTKDS